MKITRARTERRYVDIVASYIAYDSNVLRQRCIKSSRLIVLSVIGNIKGSSNIAVPEYTDSYRQMLSKVILKYRGLRKFNRAAFDNPLLVIIFFIKSFR